MLAEQSEEAPLSRPRPPTSNWGQSPKSMRNVTCTVSRFTADASYKWRASKPIRETRRYSQSERK